MSSAVHDGAHLSWPIKCSIKSLEKELQAALKEKDRGFSYHWERGKVTFERDALAKQRMLKQWLPSYIRDSRFLVLVTSPVIYAGIVPFWLLDVFLAIHQGICFPIYGIPKVRRQDYLVFDRGGLKYFESSGSAGRSVEPG